jgi:hypothetical protein
MYLYIDASLNCAYFLDPVVLVNFYYPEETLMLPLIFLNFKAVSFADVFIGSFN